MALKQLGSNTRTALTTALEKGQFLKKIRSLGRSREDLTSLRSQMADIQSQLQDSSALLDTKKHHAPNHVRAIQQASGALHEALSEAWFHCCHESAHLQHNTVLCLDARVDDCV